MKKDEYICLYLYTIAQIDKIYYPNCLQEIVDHLPHAEWYIHIDDVDVTGHFDF